MGHLALAVVLVVAAAEVAHAQDRDGDGLSDADELHGVAGQPLLDLPAYGVNPDQRDMLVQADWFGCDPSVEFCGPEQSFDRYQLSSAAALRLAAYFLPDIHLHVDNGVAAPSAAAALVHGDWGGAHRVPKNEACPDSLGRRMGYFHHGNFGGLGVGGGGDLYGFCFGADSVRMGVAAQEIGHNLGLQHGGNAPSYPANCKPNYRSPMNYAYTYDDRIIGYSRGTLLASPLDPRVMDEQRGLGTTDPLILQSMRELPWDYLVTDEGAIDWNRDGEIESGTVRAAPTWAWASCEQSIQHSSGFATGATDATIAWLPDAVAPRFTMIMRALDGALVVHSATRFDACDLTDDAAECMDWSPANNDDSQKVPGAPVSDSSPVLAGWKTAGGAARLTLVAADASGQLQAQTFAQGAWSAPLAIPGGMVDGAPTLSLMPGAAHLLLVAPQAGSLLSWTLDLASGTWSTASAAHWADDDTPLAVCDGVGLTLGYRRGDAQPSVFAALPTGLLCTVSFARLGDDGRWERIDDAVAWQTGAPPTGSRVSLAYVSSPLAPDDGRFYVAFSPLPVGAALIALSEGNDFSPDATTHRFSFKRGTYLRNLWDTVSATGGVSLEFDATYDANLRAVQSTLVHAPGVEVNPFADGIISVVMRDQDDYQSIYATLGCCLTATCQP